MAPFNEEIRYFAYKYKTALGYLCILTCPFACCITCPLCCYLSPPQFGPCGTGRINARRRRRDHMTAVHFEHRARKMHRRKSLSVGTAIGRWRGLFTKPTSDQSRSPLFSTLPFEIRTLILQYALTDTGAVHVHDGRGNPKFKSVKATSCPLDVTSPLHRERDQASIPDRYSKTALLRTCRRIYTEARPILYSQTQFVFNGFPTFKNFSNAIPSSHFQQIRSVRFHFDSTYRFGLEQVQKELVNVVGSWHSLRTVHVVIDIDRPDWWNMTADTIEHGEQPARAISGVASLSCIVHVYIFEGTNLQHHAVKRGTRDPTRLPLVEKE